MPFVLQVKKGKEKKIQQILEKNNVNAVIPPLREYVICYSKPPAFLKELPYISKTLEITHEEAQNLMDYTEKNEEIVGGKDVVNILSGAYQGFKGLVTKIENDMVSLNVVVFGTVIPLDIAASEVQRIDNMAIWDSK